MTPTGSRPPMLSRVELRNYKSIAHAKVELAPITALVGRNGAGKSNFFDALRFVMDGLQTSLDHAVRSRGGMENVRRRSTGHPRNFSIRLTLNLSAEAQATYAFEIGAKRDAGFFVKWEELQLGRGVGYRVEDGKLVGASVEHLPPATSDRLALVHFSGLPAYRPAYDALVAMGFYNLNPEEMKKAQVPDSGETLARDGRNLASVLARLERDQPESMDRVRAFLEAIVPGIKGIKRAMTGPWETLEFSQDVRGASHPWRFFAASMSDGTLRALGRWSRSLSPPRGRRRCGSSVSKSRRPRCTPPQPNR